MNNVVVKSYENWEGSLNEYLKVGDKVDEEMYNHFLNILPPLIFTDSMLQVSEPYDWVGSKNTYVTFILQDGYWTYMGHCHRGESVNR